MQLFHIVATLIEKKKTDTAENTPSSVSIMLCLNWGLLASIFGDRWGLIVCSKNLLCVCARVHACECVCERGREAIFLDNILGMRFVFDV